MWSGMSTEAGLAVGQSHGLAARIIITSPGVSQTTLPLSDGSVTVDCSSQTRRTASIVADPHYWPTKPTDLLAPFGSYGDIQSGIRLVDGSIFWVPLGRFYLDKTERQRPISQNAGLTVTLSDKQSRIAEDRATSPIQTVGGATCVAEIMRIIRLTDPSISFYIDPATNTTQVAPQIMISQDKWSDGIEPLADAIGAEVFSCQDPSIADFVIRPTPSFSNTPVWTVGTGVSGNIISADDSLDRSGVYNQFVISGTRADGTVAVSAIVQDTDPASPTYINGLFGKRTRYYTSALLTTTGQCIATGQSFLNRVKGFAVIPTLQALPNPALDGGDVITYADVYSGASPIPIILSKVVHPLAPNNLQELDVQIYTLPDEGGS